MSLFFLSKCLPVGISELTIGFKYRSRVDILVADDRSNSGLRGVSQQVSKAWFYPLMESKFWDRKAGEVNQYQSISPVEGLNGHDTADPDAPSPSFLSYYCVGLRSILESKNRTCSGVLVQFSIFKWSHFPAQIIL